MNASNKIIFLYHFLMKRDRVSEAEIILYTYPKFKSQERNTVLNIMIYGT